MRKVGLVLSFAFWMLWGSEVIPPPLADQTNTNQKANFSSENQEMSQDLDTSASKKPNPFFYTADFGFFFDNLEESSTFWDTRTLIAARLMPEVGFKFFGQNIRAGGFFTLNMGEKYPKQWGITLSYDFSAKDFAGYFGIFSKKHKIGKYPLMFYRQDYDFFNPIFNGVMLQYASKANGIEAEFIFDWYGGDLIKRIDEFLIQGSIRQGLWEEKFYWGGSFLLYHTKNDELLNSDGGNLDTFLLDRLYYQVYLGTDLTSIVPVMDRLSFQIGTLSSLERKRKHSVGVEPFSNQLGWQFETEIAYKGFGVSNLLYWGDPQYKYFSEYGENLYAGVPFYQSKLYDRAELFYQYENQYLKTRASFILHITPKGVANQQMITLIVDTERLFSSLFR